MRTLAVLLVLAACTPGGTKSPARAGTLSDVGAAGLASIRPEALRAHVKFLSDDLLAGREPGTPGHAIAAQYFAAQLAAAGVEPAGDDGTFFQAVPLRGMTRVDAGCKLALAGKALPAEQVIFMPFAGREKVELTAPLVYVGFGVSAPEQSYDDLAGVDLKGKIAVVFRGAPPSFQPASARALYSAVEGKAAALAARGAVGMLVAYPPEAEKIRSWEKRQGDNAFESMAWREGDQPGAGVVLPWAMVRMNGFQTLLGSVDAGQLWTDAVAGKAKAVEIPGQAQLAIEARFRDLTSPNVVGILRGSDPARAKEIVLYSAHSDHMGVGAAKDGDSIYNGALDNSVGLAAVLEIARAFAALPERPARSIVFLAVTAEERGMLGSDYFAHHPTVPMADVAANVNLDGPNPLYEVFDVIPLGAEHSTIMAHVEAAAREMGLVVSPDPAPEQVYFIRSDQFSFVKKGVPAVFPVAGYRDAGGKSETNKALSDAWEENNYHQPSDEWDDATCHADLMAKEVRFDFLLGLSLARAPARPTWNPDSPFAKMGR